MSDRSAPAITAIATRVPGDPHDQLGIAERMIALHGLDRRDARRLRGFYLRTRIDARHSVLTDDWTRATARAFFVPGGRAPSTAARMAVFAREAPPLAGAAAHALLARSGASGGALDPREVDHLIVVSCTGFVAPGLDVLLVRDLRLRADVGRSVVGFQGCHAGLAALRLAADITRARASARVLIVCVELSTIHFQHALTTSNLLANALFGDGAAAVLVDGAGVSRGPGPALEIAATETYLLPDGASDMRWEVGDEGFTLALSDRLPALLRCEVGAVVGGAREGHWAVHPGGAAILDAIEAGLALDPRALAPSRDVLRRVGNLSSPTVYAVMEQVLATAGRSDGEHMTAMAFGPGLTVELARLRVRRDGEEEACVHGRISRHAVVGSS